MANEDNNQNLLVGAAVVAGILGTLSALVRSSKTVHDWTEQAKDAASQAFEKGGEGVNKNMLLGGVAGGLIGAATALLLAPKSGVDLIKDITYSISHPREMMGSTARRASSVKSAAKKSVQKGVSSAKGAAAKVKKAAKSTAKTVESKAKKATAKSRSPSSRRRVQTAHHHAVGHEHGKTEMEVTGAEA